MKLFRLRRWRPLCQRLHPKTYQPAIYRNGGVTNNLYKEIKALHRLDTLGVVREVRESP